MTLERRRRCRAGARQLADSEPAEKRQLWFINRVIDGIADLGYPLSITSRRPRAFPSAFDTFAEMLAYWTPRQSPSTTTTGRLRPKQAARRCAETLAGLVRCT